MAGNSLSQRFYWPTTNYHVSPSVRPSRFLTVLIDAQLIKKLAAFSDTTSSNIDVEFQIGSHPPAEGVAIHAAIRLNQVDEFKRALLSWRLKALRNLKKTATL